ncbi:MAG TPA: ribonuclease HI [Spirochaetia bacterium]|nr:ribonuclease HI [Spirochaetia bacterium]
MSQGIQIWTDGGCQGNPGPGAWAFVLRSPSGIVERSGYEGQTTNNRMELVAVQEALRELTAHPEWREHAVNLSTDSQYVQKGITEWIKAWERNGWRTSAKKPVKNVDLWSSLAELARQQPITWTWVMGHAGNEMNERCHSLVEESIARGRNQER